MAEPKNVEDRFDNCKWQGTPQCPHIAEMKTVFIREVQPGKPTPYFSLQDLKNDAKLCKDCDKYEPETLIVGEDTIDYKNCKIIIYHEQVGGNYTPKLRVSKGDTEKAVLIPVRSFNTQKDAFQYALKEAKKYIDIRSTNGW